jgi:hypothetical protein
VTTLTPELMDQIRKLSPADKALVQEELTHEVEPLSDEWNRTQTPRHDEILAANSEEFRLRAEAIISGQMKSVSFDQFREMLKDKDFAERDYGL